MAHTARKTMGSLVVEVRAVHGNYGTVAELYPADELTHEVKCRNRRTFAVVVKCTGRLRAPRVAKYTTRGSSSSADPNDTEEKWYLKKRLSGSRQDQFDHKGLKKDGTGSQTINTELEVLTHAWVSPERDDADITITVKP